MQPVVPEISTKRIHTTKKIEAKGAITVKKNKRGMVETVIFTDAEGNSYTVKRQGQGRMLSTANGKNVEIKGKTREKGETNLLIVSSFKILP